MATEVHTPTAPEAPHAASSRGGPRDVRRARRLIAAVLLPIPAVAVAVLRGVWPAFSESDTAGALGAIARSPGAEEAVVWLSTVIALTMVPAILAATRLARRRRPALAMITAGVNLVAWLSTTALYSADVMALVAARPEYDQAQLVPYLDAVAAHPVNAVGLGGFVLGHIVGMILLGAALWRIIPRWASVALIVSQPLHFVAYVVLGVQPLDAFSWALTAIGFVACSVAILRTADSDWDLAPEVR
jgi:hypothetical protein